METEDLPDVSYLHDCLSCDRKTGVLTWRQRDGRASWNARFAGKEAGCVNSRGYVTVRLLGRTWYAHRVVWAMCYGCWPEQPLDHIDGNPRNNRPDNLREARAPVNLKNASKNRRNTSGVTGVSWDKKAQKWEAYLTDCYSKKHLGLFSNLEEAVAARKAAEAEYGFHPNHGRTRG